MEANNMAAMREALERFIGWYDVTSIRTPCMRKVAETARAALAKPLRNCDVGTAKEQESRWKTNCGPGIPNCKHCKVYEEAKNSGLVNDKYFMRCDCRFIWMRMPYEEEEGK